MNPVPMPPPRQPSRRSDPDHFDRAEWLHRGLPRIRDLMGMPPEPDSATPAAALPFGPNDATAGAENELQTVVMGTAAHVDLPLTIAASNYFRNLEQQARAGEITEQPLTDLGRFLSENPERVWEHSWVRFHHTALSDGAREIFEQDLRADKCNPDSPPRCDASRFTFIQNGERHIRVPVSYLLKLALADALHAPPSTHPTVRRTGEQLMGHFLNDNTSPETFSFHPVSLRRRAGMGKALARETAKRFLLCQLLTLYANQKFGLDAGGQRALVYFAPHTHLRQKRLNDMISDAFYRDLFMSPCLCGWNKGEAKHRYMGLCHQVLSRSQLNAISKLREAGIITRNLVVLPSVSNVSLANNGTHISLGSRKLSRLMADPDAGLGPAGEKIMGDLATKITEHFLPLFVGTYSAAPYRLDFQDFHPEKVLGFLPHELDAVHLRMIWRRWKKKAKLKVFGRPVTPFGPEWLDRRFAALFRLRGDLVDDFRLLDYFVAILSTETSPGLDGRLGNDARLRRDLADFGIFDPAMPAYLPNRLRNFQDYGFSGFEGRYYSLFMDLEEDMGHAATLQNLITALAFKYLLTGQVTHEQIPDSPFVESERRQIFFGAAIGIPTFFVRGDTDNRFLARIIEQVPRKRKSRRYSGYIRIYNKEYRKALVTILRQDAADLIEMMGAAETLADLEARLTDPETGSAGRLIRGILDHAGERSAHRMPARVFNQASEGYYREVLRPRQMHAAQEALARDFKRLDAMAALKRDGYADMLAHILGDRSAALFFEAVQEDLKSEEIPTEILVRLIHLTLLTIHADLTDYAREPFPS